jgi:hypothetical protein
MTRESVFLATLVLATAVFNLAHAGPTASENTQDTCSAKEYTERLEREAEFQGPEDPRGDDESRASSITRRWWSDVRRGRETISIQDQSLQQDALMCVRILFQVESKGEGRDIKLRRRAAVATAVLNELNLGPIETLKHLPPGHGGPPSDRVKATCESIAQNAKKSGGAIGKKAALAIAESALSGYELNPCLDTLLKYAGQQEKPNALIDREACDQPNGGAIPNGRVRCARSVRGLDPK